jgi:hypothetical protein
MDLTNVNIEEGALEALLAIGVDLTELRPYDYASRASAHATNGSDSVYRFDLPDGRFVFLDCPQGTPETVFVAPVGEDSIEVYVREFCYQDYVALSEYMVEWGFDGLDYEDEAGPDYAGRCRIWSEPHYYAGTCGAPSPGYAKDDDGRVLQFQTYAKAKAYVDNYYNAENAYDGVKDCNVLAHGQSAADTLTIIKDE